MKKWIFVYLLPVLIFAGCTTGTKLGNLSPETKIFLDKIDSPDRLTSVVTMHWSGEDPDGYVKEYEISFDNSQWISVSQRTDSTFRFEIVNSNIADIQFYVRAVDNEGKPDPSPAYLLIPIKNTPPTLTLDQTKPVPDTVYSVFSVLWIANDLDGEENLDSVFIKVNNGNWVALPKSIDFVSVIPSAPKVPGIQNALLYKGTNALLHPSQLQGLNVGQMNRIYVKAKDKGGIFSEPDSSAAFLLLAQNADFLVIDEHKGSSNPNPESVYFPALANIGISYDYFDMNAHPLPFLEPALGLYMGLYDVVFWYSDGSEYAEYGDQVFVEIAANTFQNYLNKGGKLLISTKFPSRFNSLPAATSSAVFAFSPMESFSTASGQARIPMDSSVYSVGAYAGDYPTLKPSVFMSLISPFYAKNTNDNLYQAQLQASGGWTGPSAVCGTSRFTNGRINQVFFSLELHKLNGDQAAFETTLNKILKEEFLW